MAPETQPTLTPTEKLFADNPQLAHAVQVYGFAQWFFPAEIDKELALLGVDPKKLSLDDPESVRVLLEFEKRFFEKHPDEQTRVEQVFPKETVESGLTYAEKIYAEARRRTFVEKATDNWVRQLKKQGVSTVALASEATKRIEQATKNERDPQKIIQTVEAELSHARGIALAPAQLTQLATIATQEAQNSLQFVDDQRGAMRAITNAILRSPTERPDITARILTYEVSQNPQLIKNNEITQVALARATELERTSLPFVADFVPDPVKLGTGPEKFFQSYANTSAEKFSAVISDGLMKFVSPTKQWEIAEALLGKSFDRVIHNTELLTQRFGEGFVESELYKYLLTTGREALVERKGSVASGMEKTKGLLDDVITPLVRGPVEPLDKHFLDIIELTKAGVFSKEALGKPSPASISDRPFIRTATSLKAQELPTETPVSTVVIVLHTREIFFSLVHRQEAGRHAFEFLKDIGGWIFSWGAKEGTKKAAEVVAKKGATTAVGKVVGGAIGSLFGPVVGTWFGAIVGDIVLDKALGLIGAAWGGLKGLASFSWITGAGGKSELTDDVALVLALVSVAFIPILLVYMLFTDVVRNSAYIEANQIGGVPENAIYGPVDYIDFANLGPFDCFSPQGTATAYGARPLTQGEQNRITEVVESKPQLSLLSCALNCSTNKINLTAFDYSCGSTYGYAKRAYPGNVTLCQNSFTGPGLDDEDLARLLAHELGHEIEYFRPEIFDQYYEGTTTGPRPYCGALGTYIKGEAETPNETFAEAIAIYIMDQQNSSGVNILYAKCPSGYAFIDSLFKQCQ